MNVRAKRAIAWGRVLVAGAVTMVATLPLHADAPPLDAGFHTVVLHPVFDARLGSLDLAYLSSYGEIRSSWTVKGTTAEWHLTIPANATGWLALSAAEAAKYKVDGGPLGQGKQVKASTRDGQSGFEFEAGSYAFVVQL